MDQGYVRGRSIWPVLRERQDVAVPVISEGSLVEGVNVVCHKNKRLSISNITKSYLLQFAFNIFHLNILIKRRRVQWPLNCIVSFIYHPIIIHLIAIMVIYDAINGFWRPLGALLDNNILTIFPVIINNWRDAVYPVA